MKRVELCDVVGTSRRVEPVPKLGQLSVAVHGHAGTCVAWIRLACPVTEDHGIRLLFFLGREVLAGDDAFSWLTPCKRSGAGAKGALGLSQSRKRLVTRPRMSIHQL